MIDPENVESEVDGNVESEFAGNVVTVDDDEDVDDEKRNKHKSLFEDWLKQQTGAYLITNERRDKIIQYLKNQFDANTKPIPTFKFYVKKNNYNIVIEPHGKETLYRTVVERRNKEERPLNLPVATQETIFDILYELHCVQRGHSGQNLTFDMLKQRYYGISKDVVVKFVQYCPRFSRTIQWNNGANDIVDD
jgi:hypothetical protein